MSILLYCAGAIAFAIGVAMAAYGIPINEFSFGNTLIIAGVTAATGGLVILALGVAVSHLQQISEALTHRGAPARPGRPIDNEPPAPARMPVQAGQARVPFPAKPKNVPRPESGPREMAAPEAHFAEPLVAEPRPAEPRPAEPRADLRPRPPVAPPPFNMPRPDKIADHATPLLPNPDEAPAAPEEPFSLSPRQPAAPSAPVDFDEPLPHVPPQVRGRDEEPAASDDEKPPFAVGWRPPPPHAPKATPSYFDALWPAGPKPGTGKPPVKADEESSEPDFAEVEPADAEGSEKMPPETRLAEPATARDLDDDLPLPGEQDQDDVELPRDDAPPAREAPRAVAILKSGVVDGMGYTLYVDGSIEAELPQGTLRFASINELRAHLEKTP